MVDGGYIEGGMYHYYMTDHLGNNRVVVNASGTVTQRNHYYPFGTAFAENTVDEQKKQPYSLLNMLNIKEEIIDFMCLGMEDVYKRQDQHFLIGKIENIDKFLTVSWGSQTMDELRKLVPEAFITSYDHRSILELSSITNVQGIPTYFDYNAKNGWLERVYSTAGQKKYLHNYYKVNLLEE